MVRASAGFKYVEALGRIIIIQRPLPTLGSRTAKEHLTSAQIDAVCPG